MRSLPLRLMVICPCSRCGPACAAVRIGKFRHNLCQRLAEHVGFRMADQPLGRAVEDADAAIGIDADDARAGAGQNRFGETAAAVDQVARAHDVVALGAQLLGHLVEGLAEMGEIAFGAADRQLHKKIAGGDEIARRRSAGGSA